MAREGVGSWVAGSELWRVHLESSADGLSIQSGIWAGDADAGVAAARVAGIDLDRSLADVGRWTGSGLHRRCGAGTEPDSQRIYSRLVALSQYLCVRSRHFQRE